MNELLSFERALNGYVWGLPMMVLLALARALPERVISGVGSPLWCLNYAGTRADGKSIAGMFFANGGYGASARRDGYHVLEQIRERGCPAPVLILSYSATEVVPGGAGNAANLEHCISKLKLAGHYCIGNVGEFWAMTSEERMRVHEINVDVTQGRVPLIAGCHHQNPYEAVKLAQHAQSVGIDFVIILTATLFPRRSARASLKRLQAAGRPMRQRKQAVRSDRRPCR